MAANSGLAFVVIQHLSPDVKSLMQELLSRHTEMNVHRAKDHMEVEPDSVYLIPPKNNMVIESGRLRLSEQERRPHHLPNFPIDMFFESLAKDLGERAIAVILSGTGTDGSRGILAVHEVGGVVLVQDPESAEFDGMPLSAIGTGVADIQLRPDQLVHAIVDFTNDPAFSLRPVGPSCGRITPDSIGQIVEILSREENIEFAHYKPTTLGRRIDRRRQIVGSKRSKVRLGNWRRPGQRCAGPLMICCI